MELQDLFDKQWKSYEKQRFLNDDTKISTNGFDAESFKHEGFEDREKYIETYVPALADETRLEQELTNFTPPRLSSINGSPYQALVIRYGILRTLIRQQEYSLEKSALLEAVQSWQQDIIDTFDKDSFSENDNLLHLAKAAMEYNNDIDDAELHLLYHYFSVRNEEKSWKHEHTTWVDLFQRLSAIDRFPKVSRSEKPAHAIDTIEKGLWSLQEQAILYEVSHPDKGDLVGIPEDYVDFIRDWLYYEISDENYLVMLEELEPFNRQSTLIEARETFGVDTRTEGLNENRRKSLVEAGVFPSDLLREILGKKELKTIVDEYDLDAHKRRTDEMIESTIEYFDRSQSGVDDEEPTADMYLQCYEDIADGNISRVPPQLHGIVDKESKSEKLDILFEEATAEIFTEIFNINGTTLLGQSAGGTVADGEITQDGQWLLWDNKRRTGPFKLDASTQAKIKSYIDTKNQQHEVEWFLIIAPEFSDSCADNALKLEVQTGVDIRLIRAADFKRLATIWQDHFADADRELPLSVFKGAGELDLDIVKDILETQF